MKSTPNDADSLSMSALDKNVLLCEANDCNRGQMFVSQLPLSVTLAPSCLSTCQVWEVRRVRMWEYELYKCVCKSRMQSIVASGTVVDMNPVIVGVVHPKQVVEKSELEAFGESPYKWYNVLRVNMKGRKNCFDDVNDDDESDLSKETEQVDGETLWHRWVWSGETSLRMCSHATRIQRWKAETLVSTVLRWHLQKNADLSPALGLIEKPRLMSTLRLLQ